LIGSREIHKLRTKAKRIITLVPYKVEKMLCEFW